jgi:Flagellar hook-length control protein FliK
MDISKLPPSPSKAPPPRNSEPAVALSHVLNVALGKTTTAHITATEAMSAPERAELLKQTAAALAQIKHAEGNNLTPALKAETARLMAQQHLIQAPALKWIKLLVNNRPLLTYSDRPLVAGQTLAVQLQGAQKLVLLDVLSSAAPPNTAQPATGTATNQLTNSADIKALLQAAIAELGHKTLAAASANTNPQLIKTLLAAALPLASHTANSALSAQTSASSSAAQTSAIQSSAAHSHINPSDSALAAKAMNISSQALTQTYALASGHNHKPPETTATQQLISEQLRRLLPHRDTPNLLLTAITQLQQLPAASALELLSPSVAQALKSLAEQIRAPEQFTQAKVLAQAVKSSGVFFEQQLQANTQARDASGKPNTSALSTVFTQDLKGALLSLLSRTTQELNGDPQPPSTAQTLKLLQTLSSTAPLHPIGAAAHSPITPKLDINLGIGMFIQELMHKPAKELSDKELRTQLLVLLQQHSVHSLAKIQWQQLHNLAHEADSKDSAAPTSTWQTEIPVKQHGEVQHLQLRIEREWVDDKNPAHTNKSNEKIKQWSVSLRFDLPKLGEFCAQLTVINHQVSATLWAAQEPTFSNLRAQLGSLRQQLESEGIEVKSLECMRGMPPEQPLALTYSLIDIST